MTKRQQYVLWFLIAITSLFPLVFWYKAGRLIYVGDLNYPLDPLMYWASKLTQTWKDSFPGGATHSQAPSLLLYQGIPALLSLLRVNLSVAQIGVYTLWMVLPSLAIALFAEELRKRITLTAVFTYATVVLYQFNIYRMIMFGDAAHMVVYATLPLVAGLMLRGERTRDTKWAVLAGLAMVLAAPAGPNPPMYAVFVGALTVIFIYCLATSSHRRETLGRFGIWFATLLVTNAFWIAPFLAGQLSVVGSGGLGNNNLAGWVDSVSGTSDWYNLLRLQGSWDWYAGFNNQPYVPYSASYQTHPFLIGWSLAFPAIAALALIIRRRNWGFVALMAIFGVVGFFLAMGTHEPMMLLFRWLVQHVPMFWIFRSPWYKFGLWQTLAMVILASLTIDVVTSWLRDHWRWIRPILPVIGAVLVIGAGVSVYPFITGKKFPAATAYLNVPDYITTNAAALTLNEPGELLLLPSAPAFNYTWMWSGLIDPLFYVTKNRLLYTAQQIGTDATNPTRGWLSDAFTKQLYAANGASAAQGILAWIRPQALLQRDDIDYAYYGSHDSPAFIKSRIAAIGLVESAKSGVSAPWHVYETGFKETRFQLSRDVIFTRNQPDVVLGPLAELGLLTPNTAFVTTEADREKVIEAQIPLRDVVIANLDDPTRVTSETSYDVPATPSRYRIVAKQAPGITESPNLTIDGITDLSWTSMNNSWWQSAPIISGAKITLNTSSPRNAVEHAPSFHSPNVWQIEDVDAKGPGIPHFVATVTPSPTDQLNLSTDAHSLMYKAPLTNMEPSRLYKLTFEYQTDGNAKGRYSVHLGGVEVTAVQRDLEPVSEWTPVVTTFRVVPGTTSASLNFFSFSPTVGTIAHQSYRNVHVTEISSLERVLFEEKVNPAQQLSSTGAITLLSQVPTRVVADLPSHVGSALLTFDQQFDANWQLAGIEPTQHFASNWYANSWILPTGGSTTILVNYSVQRWFWFGIGVSLVSLICLLILAQKGKYRRHGQ